MSNRSLAAFLALPLLLALPAAAQTPARTQCLQNGLISDFSPIKGNDRALIVTDQANRRYKVNLTIRCGGLDFHGAIGIQTLESGRLACVSRGDTVLSRDPDSFNRRCPIASVEPYTPAMEAADKAKAATIR